MANQYREITKKILLCVGLAGALTLAVTAPHATAMLWKIISKKLDPNEKAKLKRQKFYDALYRLRKSRLLITKTKTDGTCIIELTEHGKRKVKEFRFNDLSIERMKKWDGIWRIVIFDIPNKKTPARNALRYKLRELGFSRLHKSVWVIPYPCEKEIEFIVEFFNVYPYVQIIDATKIKNDALLRKYYDLF